MAPEIFVGVIFSGDTLAATFFIYRLEVISRSLNSWAESSSIKPLAIASERIFLQSFSICSIRCSEISDAVSFSIFILSETRSIHTNDQRCSITV